MDAARQGPAAAAHPAERRIGGVLKLLLLPLALVALGLSGLPAGAAANCTINGTSGNDVFTAEMQTDGPDDICGLGGADIFEWSPGHDAYYGGAGRDTIDVSGSLDHAADIWLAQNYVRFWSSGQVGCCQIIEQDVVDRVENVVGTPLQDSISGDAARNVIRGGGGGDRLYIAGAADLLYGQAGGDTFVVQPTGAMAQPRRVNGGLDTDTVTAFDSSAGVTADLYERTFSSADAVFSMAGIENVLGSQGPDTIQGNDVSNLVFGYHGDDTLLGGGGNDILYGFEDVDTANGQAGALDECDAEFESFCER
jgi:Ca2+-binding RTX toxin-like protein